MKIIFVIGSLDSGGAEKVVSIIANSFSQNNQIHIITWSGNDSFYNLKNNIEHHKLNLSYSKKKHKFHLYFNFLKLKRLTNQIDQIKPDIVISFITSTNIIAIIATNISKIPIIISERSNLFTTKINPFWFRLRKLIYKYSDILVLQTVESMEIAQVNGIASKRILVVPNPIEKYSFHNTIKSEIILFVGRLSKEKRVKDLIVAFYKIQKSYDDYELWIVGDGPENNNLKELTKELNLFHKVKFLGRKKDVKNYYRKANIFVLPSVSEGFPNVILEAMSNDCIVISSNCSMGPKEIITDNVDGFLYEPKNTESLIEIINYVIEHPSLHDEIINNGHNKLRLFSEEKITNEWMKIVDSLVK